MAAATQTPSRLKTSEIEVVKDFNPRTTMDKQKLDELAKSIKVHGLLQPLVVGEKNDKGKYPLVAGHRRLAALKQNRTTEVDVKVLSVNGNAKAIAVTENLQREQVNAIDEARGFQDVIEAEGINQKQLAERLGISTSQISDRLALLKLPKEAQAGIEAGKIPPAAAPWIQKLAKVSEKIAATASKLIESGEIETVDIDRDLRSVLTVLRTAVNKQERMCMISGTRFDMWDMKRELKRDTKERSELFAKLSKADDDWDVPHNSRPNWTKADVDAARSYGCLLEFKVDGQQRYYFTDLTFLWDRFEVVLDRYVKAKAKVDAEKRKRAKDNTPVDEKAKRAAEREAQRKAALKAYAHNTQLGARIQEQFATLDVTVERLRVLAMLILNDNGNDQLAGGLSLVFPDWHDAEIKELKDGREKLRFTPIPPASAIENLKRLVMDAKTSEEILGLMFGAMVASKFSDREAATKSTQFKLGWTPPGSGYYSVGEYDQRPAINREAVPVLDGKVREAIEAEIAEAAETDADDAEGSEEVEHEEDVALEEQGSDAAEITQDPLTEVDKQLDAEAAEA